MITIHWSGKGNYISDGDEIRRAAGTEIFSWYCASIADIKRTFGIRYAEIMNWAALR